MPIGSSRGCRRGELAFLVVEEREMRKMTRRELLGYWPMLVLGLVVAAVTSFTVALGLGS